MSVRDFVRVETVDEPAEHERLAVRQLFERDLGVQLPGPLEAKLVEQRGAIRPPDDRLAGEDTGQRRTDLVERHVLADPTIGARLDALRQHHAAALSGHHHHVRSR